MRSAKRTRDCSESSISHKNRKKLRGSKHFWKMRSAKCAPDCNESDGCISKHLLCIENLQKLRGSEPGGQWNWQHTHDIVARARSCRETAKNWEDEIAPISSFIDSLVAAFIDSVVQWLRHSLTHRFIDPLSVASFMSFFPAHTQLL